MKNLDEILKRLSRELPAIDLTGDLTKEKVLAYINDGLEDFSREIVKLTPLSLLKIYDASYSGMPLSLDDLQFNHISKVTLDGQRLEPLSDITYNSSVSNYYAVEYTNGSKVLKIDPCLKSGRLQILYFRNLAPLSVDKPALEYPELGRYLVLNAKALLLADDGFPQADRFFDLAKAELGTVLESFQLSTDSSSNKLVSDDDLDIWGEMT